VVEHEIVLTRKPWEKEFMADRVPLIYWAGDQRNITSKPCLNRRRAEWKVRSLVMVKQRTKSYDLLWLQKHRYISSYTVD